MSCCCNGEDSAPQDNHSHSRTCTDILWLCLFILFWFVMIFIAAFAYVYGNPLRLINGYDSFGNTCGVSYNEKVGKMELSGLNTSGNPHVFYLDMRHIRISLKLCVKKCPDETLRQFADIKEFYKRTGSLLCTYGFNLYSEELLNKDASNLIQSSMGPCPPLPVYESVSVLNRCVPRPVKESVDQIYNIYSVLNSWDTVEQVLGDLYMTWKEIVGLTVLAFVLSLLMIAILHLLASFVAYIFMVIVVIASIAGTGVLWWTYADLKHQLDNTPENQMLQESVNNESAFLIYSIVATVITVIILLLVVAVCKSVGRMTQLFEDSAECLADIPSLFLLPFVTFIALMFFFIFWISVIVCLATSTYPGAESFHPFLGSIFPQSSLSPFLKIGTLLSEENLESRLSSLEGFTFLEYVEPSWVRYMWWFYLIGLVWTAEFILSCQQMVIAGTVSQWVFSNHRGDRSGSVLFSMGKLICYHLGSVAKGSMLITIFKLPRLILTYIDRKLKKHKDAGSQCAACGMKACICCLYCLENFIRFINHNAYTVIAMEGYSFCTSAKIAFNTLVNNALDLATLNSVGDFMLFLAKCFVTAATGAIGLLIMKQNVHLHFYAVPTLIVCVFAYFIAHSVLSLYEIVIDTMFLCDSEGKRLYGNEWGKSPGTKRDTNGISNQPCAFYISKIYSIPKRQGRKKTRINQERLDSKVKRVQNTSFKVSSTVYKIVKNVNYNKEDTLLGISNKKVILENSLLAGGDASLNVDKKSAADLTNTSSQDFILNESSGAKEIDDKDEDVENDELGPEQSKTEEKANIPSSGILDTYDASIDSNLPETVALLTTPEGSKVYLVGTAHFSLESQNDVAKIIQAVQPHIVLVELCNSRVNILQLDEKTILEEAKNINFEKIRSTIKQNGLFQGLMYILLLSMSAHLTKQLGMAPGGEFRRAFAE
ncbi:hypothetical protein L9F63_001828, partial [Diploptera punctata]